MKDNKLSPIGTTIPMNYDALEYLTWFVADTQNVQNWAGTIFRGGINDADPRLIELLNAAINSIAEVQNDITKLQEFLAAYNPLPNSVTIDTKNETNQ